MSWMKEAPEATRGSKSSADGISCVNGGDHTTVEGLHRVRVVA